MIKVGFGTDLHPLLPGNGLMLGGMMIPGKYTAAAHSDGDVLLHALIDALLGVCCMGDIGDHFPASRVRMGERSAILLAETLQLTSRTGMRIVNIDSVVDLEVIKLKNYKRAIAENVARLLAIDPGVVSVKAKTAEGLGSIGEGRAVGAQVALLAEFPE